MKSLPLFITALSVSLLVATSARAATLSGSVGGSSDAPNPGLSANLTTTGNVDWAIWNDSTGSPGNASFAPTNQKSGGTLGISAITPVTVSGQSSSTTVRGSTSTTGTLFTYTDGTTTTAATNVMSDLVFNNDLNQVGSGVKFTLAGEPGQLLQLDIWAGGFTATGLLTVTLNDATTLTLTSQAYNANGTPKGATLFTVLYQPDSISDLLNVSYIASASTNTSGHVAIQAVSISTVPEPGVGGLWGGIGMILGAGIRWRRARPGA
jgi:hypothetical protein